LYRIEHSKRAFRGTSRTAKRRKNMTAFQPLSTQAPLFDMTPQAPVLPSHLLDIGTIYHEPNVEKYARGREILARFPDAQRIEVPSHWNIAGLHGNEGESENWLRNKRTVLVVGVRKSLQFRPNGRSADFIAPGHANGCAMSCAYCYVPRRKGFANPISTFVNIEQIQRAIERHAQSQGRKVEPNSVDSEYWIYEIGENSDCSVDALLCNNVRDLVEQFRALPHAKATWATKFVNRDLLRLDPQGRTRLRFSLMPPEIARVVDVRTSPMAERIAAINDFVDAGYEMHLNFSPVILHDGWRRNYVELFQNLNDVLSARTKAQLACEIIFLTHNAALHEVNLGWHPKAEELLWTPENQEAKQSQMGGENVRYRSGFKGQHVREFRELLTRHMPYCTVRYAF
jgi:spore photoproduct lyase family protein